MKFIDMKEKATWARAMYIVGVVALIIGAVDPMEGSVVIAIGSTLAALSTYVTHDRDQKIFFAAMIMIVLGVFFLFYFSSLGGIGGHSTLSLWWGILILPYPMGWLISIITVIIRAVKKRKLQGTP